MWPYRKLNSNSGGHYDYMYNFPLTKSCLWYIISSVCFFKHSALCTFNLVGCGTVKAWITVWFVLSSCSSHGIATCHDHLVNQWLHWKTRRLTKAFSAILKLPSFCFMNIPHSNGKVVNMVIIGFWCEWVRKSQYPLKTHTLLLCPGRRMGLLFIKYHSVTVGSDPCVYRKCKDRS